MEHLKKSADINIRGTVYFYELLSDSDNLQLSFEEKESAKRWKGEFSANYIETLTQKSKSFKKFPIFLKMLLSGLDATSDSVIIDLLTYQELEMFRSSRNPGNASSQASNPKLMTKRYLILTFSGEFERVHYPLPLAFEEAPNIENLQKTITRLKSELEQAKKIKELEIDPLKLMQENEELKQHIKKIEHNQILAAVPRKGAVEIDNIIRESKLLEQENESLKLEGTKEVKILRKENQELQHELDRVKKEMDSIIQQLERETGSKVGFDEVNAKVLLLSQQFEKSQRQEAKYKREIEAYQKEIENSKQIDVKQKQRIKQLEEELESALNSRSGLRNSSPASRSNPRVPAAAVKSPQTRSPRISTRLGTPPGSRENSRGSGRPGSDRIGVRYSPNTRNRASPNRNSSPGSIFNRKNQSPVSRLKTPPNKASPARKASPQQSPAARKNNPAEEKKSSNSNDLDSRIKKITELIKKTKN
jgi:coiled-coil domain-containing protein 61